MTKRQQQLDKLEDTLRRIPVPTGVTRAGFKRFRETGELPDDDRLGRAVIHWVRVGPEIAQLQGEDADESVLLRASVAAAFREPNRPVDEATEALYDEAVSKAEPTRTFARMALKMFASNGIDVTRPVLAEGGVKIAVPEYGSVGAEAVGFPKRLAIAPFKEQAARLFARLDALRKRIPHDQHWFVRLSDATQRFWGNDERPEDDLMLDAILVIGELDALARHASGESVTDLMAAFDAAAREKGDEREAAITRLQELVKDGRLLGGAGD